MRTALVALLHRLINLICLHSSAHVCADLNEGEHYRSIAWCRACGAYRNSFGQWRSPGNRVDGIEICRLLVRKPLQRLSARVMGSQVAVTARWIKQHGFKPWLTACTVDEACQLKPMRLSVRFWRFVLG